MYRVLHELGAKYYISNEQGKLIWLDKAGFALTEELPSRRSRVASKPKLSIPTPTYRLKRFYKPDHSYSSQLRHCKPVVNPTKLSIFERDNYLCFYCLYRGTVEDLTVDHQIPKSKGGSNDSGNLVTCCIPCNRAKGDLTEDEFWGVLAKADVSKTYSSLR